MAATVALADVPEWALSPQCGPPSRGMRATYCVCEGDKEEHNYVVIGRNGATLREGVELSTAVVGTVPAGSRVTGAEVAEVNGLQRVRLTSPVEGWCSLKVLAACDVSETLTVLSDAGKPVGALRRFRTKVTVAELAESPPFPSNTRGWARVTSPVDGWLPLYALELDDVCSRRYRLNDPSTFEAPPNIVNSFLRGDGELINAPIRCAWLDKQEATSGGIGKYLRRTAQMQLVTPRDFDIKELPSTAAGLGSALASLVLFLCDEGVLWRKNELYGCRFAVARGVYADLLMLLLAMTLSGHLADALSGCDDKALWPESMAERSHYLGRSGAWFMPIAACLVGPASGQERIVKEWNRRGGELALEVRRSMTRAPADATAEDMGFKSKSKNKPLFTENDGASLLQVPTLHVIGKRSPSRANAERRYLLFAENGRRVMYHDGGPEMPAAEHYGAEVCRFVARHMMEDAGTTWDVSSI